MQLFETKTYYAITDFIEHNELKETLLKYIDELPLISDNDVSKTDWALPKQAERKYLNLFFDNFHKYITELADKFCFKEWNIPNGWFHQYTKDSSFDWHVHPEVMYSSVYYLELPDETIRTEFFDPVTNQSYFLRDVREGQVITFPSTFIHRSPVNKTDKRKTVIAFNTDFNIPKNQKGY